MFTFPRRCEGPESGNGQGRGRDRDRDADPGSEKARSRDEPSGGAQQGRPGRQDRRTNWEGSQRGTHGREAAARGRKGQRHDADTRPKETPREKEGAP